MMDLTTVIAQQEKHKPYQQPVQCKGTPAHTDVKSADMPALVKQA